MKKILKILVVSILVLSLVACGSSNEATSENMDRGNSIKYSNSDMMVKPEFGGAEVGMDFVEEMDAPIMDNSAEQGPTVIDTSRKIIKSANLELETIEFDKSINLLKAKISLFGGYVESSNVTGKSINNSYGTRNAYFSLRIPKEMYVDFLSDMNTIGTILRSNENGQDITDSYFDTEAHLKTLEIQEDRLLAILMKAERIEDIITLERELSNVRYQIERLTGSLNKWDNLVDYATVSVNIYEVREITEEEIIPETLVEKISNKFDDSFESITDIFENLTVFLLGTIPFLIIWIPVIIVLLILLKKIGVITKKDKKQFEATKEEKDKKE